MKNRLKCIMIVDEDEHDNFYHEREIKKTNKSITVIEKRTGLEAIDYLKTMKKNNDIRPDLILLDINMPEMDGWEFLSEFSRLDKEIQRGRMIMMLTTSKNPTDMFRAKAWSFVSGYLNKPLTQEILEDIINTYFKD